ncbi:MAG: hypothetical protein HON70_30430, partial [Lentisphaerae bacterium]|nr:hypothetical protein [Lentisphaerota bacterium]
FHHFESRLVTRANGRSTELNPETLDQLDYLFAAFKKRGIYITADLFISRPVYAGEIWQGMKGNVDMSDFKMLVPVNETAFRNWETFSRNLMTHRNPYTGMTWAEDPALGWLSMINEGNFGNKIGGIKGRVAEDWQRAWNAWLKAHYKDAAAIATAWGEDVMGEPSANTVPLPKNATDDNRRSRDFSEFLADVEAKMFARMKRFLTEELGTKALLTNMNGWTNPLQAHLARQEYDYVDDHFYVDHPQFLEQRWRLPSRCPNTSPVAAGAPGGRGCAFTRLLDKPFTISEYNYSGPGRFRGVGGIITGCMGALQDWSVIWRFAYSHSNKNLFEPGPSGYFDLVADPLNQAAERASLCLYLRGDMKPASHTIAIAASRDDLVGKDGASGRVSPPWNALALVTKVGMSVTTESSKAPGDLVMRVGSPRDGELPLDPYAQDTGRKLVREMRKRGWLKDTNRTDLARKIHQSETEELTVDAPTDTLILNTPRTAGGYTPAGNTVEAGAVAVIVHETDATIWVSAVDDAPIASSKRLLITHLTDLQNTGAEFAERARKTLLARGELPHLVRRGTATVEVHCATPPRGVHAWALATSGRHIGSVPATVQGKTIKIPLDTLGNAGAQMLYEVVVQY